MPLETKIEKLGLSTLALVAALAVAGAVASAQAPDPGTMNPHHPPMERAMGPMGDHGRWWNDASAIDKFKLTDSQRKSMDDIYQQNRLTLVDLHAALEKEEIAMEPLMKADQPDEGKILSQIDRVAQARAELEKANARMLLGIRRQLTPEQWKQLEADRAARRQAHAAGQPGGSQGQGRRWHGQGGPGAPPPAGSPQGAPPPDGSSPNE